MNGVWPVVFFAKLLNHLGRYSRGWIIVTTFVAWITGLIENMVLAVMHQLKAMWSGISFSDLSGVNFSQVTSIGMVNAVIPLSEMLAVLIVFTTIWIAVIIIRWIKSFVPTIGN